MAMTYTKITKAEWRENGTNEWNLEIGAIRATIILSVTDKFLAEIDGTQLRHANGWLCRFDTHGLAKDFIERELLRRVNEINKIMEQIAE